VQIGILLSIVLLILLIELCASIFITTSSLGIGVGVTIDKENQMEITSL
jgi:hypothetical protein